MKNILKIKLEKLKESEMMQFAMDHSSLFKDLIFSFSMIFITTLIGMIPDFILLKIGIFFFLTALLVLLKSQVEMYLEIKNEYFKEKGISYEVITYKEGSTWVEEPVKTEIYPKKLFKNYLINFFAVYRIIIYLMCIISLFI